MKQLTLIAAATALLAAPAFAAGPVTPVYEDPMLAPAPVPMAAPSGDWTGGYVGGQLGYGDLNGDVEGYGGLAGIHAGYNWDFGSWVLGGEVDHDWSDIDIAGGAGTLDSVTRLKLRAGFDMGRTMLYATAGPAWADATVGGVGLSDNGVFAGAGISHQLTDSWIVGGELLGHQFDDFDGTGVDVDATTATLRASFKF